MNRLIRYIGKDAIVLALLQCIHLIEIRDRMYQAICVGLLGHPILSKLGGPAWLLPLTLIWGLLSILSVLLLYHWVHLLTQSHQRLHNFARYLFIFIYGLGLAYTYTTGASFDFAILMANWQSSFSIESTKILMASLHTVPLIVAILWIIGLSILERRKQWLSAIPKGRTRDIVLTGILVFGLILGPLSPQDEITRFLRSAAFYVRVESRQLVPISKTGYPLIKEDKTYTKNPENPPHIFIIAIESFSSRFIEKSAPNGKTYTPYFNALIQQGIYIEQFYGNSIQTSKGHFALLHSVIPSIRGFAFTRFKHVNTQSLAQKLRDAGYHTTFFQAFDNLYFDNTMPFLSKRGFDHVKKVTPYLSEAEKAEIWGWGPEDAVVYRRFFDYVDQDLLPKGKPIFATLATIVNHMAFDAIPTHKKHIHAAPKSFKENYANSMYLSSEQLKVFMDELRKRPALKNSIVVITGDHSIPSGEHGYTNNELGYNEESFRVPCLILWPEKLTPRRIGKQAFSQLDIAPTLLHLAKVPMGRHHFQGQNLLAPKAKQPVFLVQPYDGIYIAAVDYPLKLVHRLRDNRYHLFHLENDPMEENNLYDARAEDKDIKSLRSQLTRPIQTYQLIKENRLWPKETSQ